MHISILCDQRANTNTDFLENFVLILRFFQLFKVADRMRSMRTNGVSKNRD